MSFFECEFPRTISYQGTGGPGFNTTVNEGFSGFEQRNKNWATARGQWQVSLKTPAAFTGNRQAFLDLLRAFFLNLTGMGDGFRLFDHTDHAVTGGLIGTGDSVTRVFQLVKLYSVGSRTYVRVINKPIMSSVQDYQGNPLTNTVVIYRGGVVDPTNRWSVDATTGVVTFANNISHVSITAAVQSGGSTTYTYTLSSGAALQPGMRIVITGMADAGNNGTFYISSLGTGTFTVVNASGVTHSGQTGSGATDWTPQTGTAITADFQFHYPVRFDADLMQIQVTDSDVKDGEPLGNWANIALKELRILAGQSDG